MTVNGTLVSHIGVRLWTVLKDGGGNIFAWSVYRQSPLRPGDRVELEDDGTARVLIVGLRRT